MNNDQIIALIALGVMLVVGLGLIVIPVVGISSHRSAQDAWCFTYVPKPPKGPGVLCFKTEEECKTYEHKVVDELKYVITKGCSE